jgi:hypothetical protein
MATSNNASGNRRRISSRVFNNIKAALIAAYEKVEELLSDIFHLENIVASKAITIQSDKKGVEPVSKKLTTAEVAGYKLQLKQSKLSLKKAQKELRKAEADYKAAVKHNAACVADQSSKFNSNLAAEHKAKREEDARTSVVIEVVKGLQINNDPRLVSLTAALFDSKQFRKEMDNILDVEDNDTYVTISGLSSVKTSVYKSVKDELLRNENSDDAAAVVPAG